MREYCGKKYYSREELRQAYYDEKSYYEELYETTRKRAEELGLSLLDSSLISATNTQKYNMKIMKCGDYFQVYNYNKIKIKKDPNLEPIEINNLCKFVNYKKEYKPSNKDIDIKNILRSKFNLQRLVKSNEGIFKSFITLTFAENVTDIEEANKKFANWRTCVKRIKKDFLYVAVPEFQKRGAVHYHLLSNLDVKENPDIIIPQKGKKNCYDVKFWTSGYSSVFKLDYNTNVVGYITKYMTKDIDNRLWGKRRYLYSKDLIKPTEICIDLSNISDMQFLFDIFDTCDKKFNNVYCDKLGEAIEFTEYKLKEK